MKEITFRPLRRDKKTGKIIVASYMAWRKVWTANYSFNETGDVPKIVSRLTIINEYKGVNPDDFVYNHKGEQLFWFNHEDPDALPKNYCTLKTACEIFDIPYEEYEGEEWKVSEPLGSGFAPGVYGFDCDGVPDFSHNTAESVANCYSDMSIFEPLTVGMVVIWFGWLLMRLDNTELVY